MTRKEFDLLDFLMSNLHKAVSCVAILEQLWGCHDDTLNQYRGCLYWVSSEKVDSRSKLKLIQTVWDFGYKISDNQSS